MHEPHWQCHILRIQVLDLVQLQVQLVERVEMLHARDRNMPTMIEKERRAWSQTDRIDGRSADIECDGGENQERNSIRKDGERDRR